MKVEIIRCEDCDADAEDGKGYAVAKAMLTDISQIEAQYVGFNMDLLEEVLDTIIASLRPEIGSVGVPLMLDEGAPVPVAMRGYLAAVNCATYKIIVFDVGEDDAEENGYCAIMMPSSFDCRPHLDANRLEEAVIEA